MLARMGSWIIGLALGFVPVLALGQIIIIPAPEPPPQRVIVMPPVRPVPAPAPAPRMAGQIVMRSVQVDGSVTDLVAQLQVTQVIQNTGNAQTEAEFVFPIPPDAVIDRFTLMVDGKEFPAKLYAKEEARRIYEGIVRTQRDPALLQYLDWGLLKTNVFPVPAGATRELVLKYTQVCKRQDATCELLFPLSTARYSSKPVEQVRFNLRITDRNAIKSVYSPSYNVNVQRPDDKSAIVTFTQNTFSTPDDLRLFWTYSEKPIGATLFSYKPTDGEDGYFLLLLAPDVKPPEGNAMNKTVVFALDRSGSMSGKKIEQARNALRFVLNNLQEGDTFNIIAYDDMAEAFKPELQRYNAETRKAAMAFIDGIFSGGSTNIDGAIRKAMDMIGESSGRPAYLLFMTDGIPTVGEFDEARIAANAQKANRGNVRMFNFGVGFDVNARLLERLATDNAGVTEYVKPEEDIEASVSRFFAKLTAPVLRSPKIELSGTQTNRVYPRPLPDLFAGGQAMVAGRYRTGGPVTIRLEGKVGEQVRTLEFQDRLTDRQGDSSFAFVEKLWAVRRVGQIINELDLKGHNQELVDELVGLSTRNGILTPYTAFLADDRTNVRDRTTNAGRAASSLDSVMRAPAGGSSFGGSTTGGRAGVGMGGGMAGMGGMGMGGFMGGTYVAPSVDPNSAAVFLRESKTELQQATIAPNAGKQSFVDASGKQQNVENCLVVNNQALFLKNGMWVDPNVKEDEEKNAIVIEPFSDKWYELARENADLRPFLTIQEGVIVKIKNQVYKVNSAR